MRFRTNTEPWGASRFSWEGDREGVEGGGRGSEGRGGKRGLKVEEEEAVWWGEEDQVM